MKVFSLLLLLVCCSITANCKGWTISNSNLELSLDDQTALIIIKDKRCNKLWQQAVYNEPLKVNRVSTKGNALVVSFNGKFPFEATFSLTQSAAVEVSIAADVNLEVNDFTFPAAFLTPNKNFYLLQTDGEGLLLPADDKGYPIGTDRPFFCGGGLGMPWLGVTDTAFQTGYMAILETPYDAKLNTMKANELITFAPVWLPSMQKFGYNRKVTYHFFDKGGYVAQCKKYRDYIWKKNNVITLKDNERKTPAIAKMIGAPHIYVWDNAREVSFSQELKQSGIEKAMILWNPNHTPYPEIGYDNKIKELGYASGIYELFTDLKLRDTIATKFDENGPLRFARTAYPGLFNQLVTRQKDGVKTYSNNFGHTSCPAAMREQIEKRVSREMKEYPHESYFLDVYQANGLFECYAPEHRLTRQQFAEEVIKNHELIAKKYGVFLGGEWGADYTGSNTVFAHGMMTLHRTWWGPQIDKKGTIYYAGNWKNNQRPTQMLGTRVATDRYLKYSINEYSRVPLYELVYHDAVLSSWRWEDANHHMPEIWWKKDLFNVLYGSAPLWNLDRETWNAFKNTFIDSYKNICPWLQQIGYDEMLSHRFLTPDHKVQESVFSSGKRAIVNFGDDDFLFEGKTIKAKSFLNLEVK